MMSFNIIKPIKIIFILFFFSKLFLTTSYASVDVFFSGVLLGSPPCNVTGENVNFGDVGITKIDGVNYSQNFNISVECPANASELFISYSGMPANSFDSKAIQTNIQGLGVRLFYKGNVVAPNGEDITHITMPEQGGIVNIPLSAVPVRDLSPSFILLEGDFYVSGFVEVNYP